jgi:hypothetical protein
LEQLVLLRLHGETRTAKMRLGRRGVYHGWAEPGARRVIAVAGGFDVAIGHGRRLTRWFLGGDGFLCNTALAALLGRRAARWRSGAGRGWRSILRQSPPCPEGEQQARQESAPAKH